MRLSLIPNLRILWRDTTTVQLGTDPARAVVLEFKDPLATRILNLLDGSRTKDEVLTEAASHLLCDTDETLAVLNALWATGLLIDIQSLLPPGLTTGTRLRLLSEAVALIPRERRTRGIDETLLCETKNPTPAEAIHRRTAAKIIVTGMESLVAPVAVALAGAGIGHIDAIVDDVGRLPNLNKAIVSAASETRVAPIRAGTATIIVCIGPRPPAMPGTQWRNAAVLTVGIRDGIVLIGPLVHPHGSPCGQCLELHRYDRDPAWPVLAAQLATDPNGIDTCALTTAIASTAYITEEVLSYVDGRQWHTHGAAIEIIRPGELKRRSWAAHPRCSCHRRVAAQTHTHSSPCQTPNSSTTP